MNKPPGIIPWIVGSATVTVCILIALVMLLWPAAAHAQVDIQPEPERTVWGAHAVYLPAVELHYPGAEVILPSADDPPGGENQPTDPEVILGPAARCDFPLDVPWPELRAAEDVVICQRVFIPLAATGS